MTRRIWVEIGISMTQFLSHFDSEKFSVYSNNNSGFVCDGVMESLYQLSWKHMGIKLFLQ